MYYAVGFCFQNVRNFLTDKLEMIYRTMILGIEYTSLWNFELWNVNHKNLKTINVLPLNINFFKLLLLYIKIPHPSDVLYYYTD